MQQRFGQVTLVCGLPLVSFASIPIHPIPHRDRDLELSSLQLERLQLQNQNFAVLSDVVAPASSVVNENKKGSHVQTYFQIQYNTKMSKTKINSQRQEVFLLS